MKIRYKNFCAGVLITVVSSVAKDGGGHIRPAASASERTVKASQYRLTATDYAASARMYENNASASATNKTERKSSFKYYKQKRVLIKVYYARADLYAEEPD